MRQIDRPSARFLGLLHGQAVIRGDAGAQETIEAAAVERGQRRAVVRHSFTYVRRKRALDDMNGAFELEFEGLHEPDPAYLVSRGVIPAAALSSAPHGRS
jgi:hypothetical protein